MATSDLLAQATNPILPSTSETLWGVVSVMVPLIVVAAVVLLVARYFRNLHRSADEAATRAAATQREVVALRAELHERSAQSRPQTGHRLSYRPVEIGPGPPAAPALLAAVDADPLGAAVNALHAAAVTFGDRLPGSRMIAGGGWATETQRGTIAQVSSRSAAEQHLRDLALLRRVRDRIDREYAQPLNVEALARDAHMSAGHLSRQFRLAYGESPYAYVMTRRIERAMALLRRGDLSVTEVCFAVGCSSLGTFSTRFTELVGVSPSAYRRQAAGGTAGIPSCVEKQVTKPVRNREASRTAPLLA